MGVVDVKLERITKFYTEESDEELVKKRFNVLYTGVYDGEVTIDNDEVSEYKWIQPEKLRRLMESTPDDYTEGFIESFTIYLNKATE